MPSDDDRAARGAGTPGVPSPLSACYPNSWAVVIGVDAYEDAAIPRLACARADAEEVAGTLEGLGFPRCNVFTLLDDEATKQNIEDVLCGDIPDKAGADDRVFVFFAGHAEDKTTHTGRDLGYLLPVDVQASRVTSRGISMNDIEEWSDLIPAKHVLYVMDCCYSGLAATRDIGLSADRHDFLETVTRQRVRQIITAGSKDERAHEEGGHGIFTRVLVRGMRGGADTCGRDHICVRHRDEQTFVCADCMKTEGREKSRSLLGEARALAKQRKFGEAVAVYTTVIDTPDAPVEDVAEALLRRGTIHDEQMGKEEMAVVDYTTLIEMPEASAAQRAEALVKRGGSRVDSGSIDAALADVATVLAMPDAPAKDRHDALVIRGVAAVERGDLDGAISELGIVIDSPEAPPDQKAHALVCRGRAHGLRDSLDKALPDLTAALDVPGVSAEALAETLLLRAGVFGQLGQHEHEVADYTMVVEMSDASTVHRAKALCGRGAVYAEQGKADDAAAEYSRVIDMPAPPAEEAITALMCRGVVFAEQRRYEQATADFTSVISMADAPEDKRALAHVSRGRAYHEQNQLSSAIADYTTILKHIKDAPEDLKKMAREYRDEAIEKL